MTKRAVTVPVYTLCSHGSRIETASSRKALLSNLRPLDYLVFITVKDLRYWKRMTYETGGLTSKSLTIDEETFILIILGRNSTDDNPGTRIRIEREGSIA